MKNIFDNYINNSFGGAKQQSESKIEQFDINYRTFFPENKDAKILDIGIGRGEMLTCMRDWGYKNYNGIDITNSTVEYCKSIGLHCEFVHDTEKWLSPKENTFDVITLFDVIEHIKKDAVIEFLSTIRKSLKKNGTVIIQTPNMQAVDSNLHRYGDITHQFGLTESSFRQILIESGFSEFALHGFEWITANAMKQKMMRVGRFIYNKMIYFRRRLSGNLCPEILHPVFFAVAKK